MEVEQQKVTVDVDNTISQCQAAIHSVGLHSAINQLYPAEKQTRLNGDAANNLKIQLFMVESCYAAKDVDLLMETVSILCKKRSVIKQAITGMIQKCMEIIDLMGDSEAAKFRLIDLVREVTDGKIFVEVERARVTRKLAQIREGEGKTKEAADLMQELQVETFGSMDRRERVDFILEQLRLLLAVQEFSKAQIVSRKISSKVFENEAFTDLKLRYFELMMGLCLWEGKYLDCSRYHFQIFEATRSSASLMAAALLSVLAKHGSEQASLLNQINGVAELERQAPVYKELLRLFLTKELIRWQQIDVLFTTGLGESPVICGAREKRQAALKDRVIEHNVRVIAACYKSVTLQRLTDLLELPLADAEQHLCSLISEHMIQAKIDRVAGTVAFRKASQPEEVLNEWASKTDALLALLVRTNHAIAKEEMTKRIQ